MKTEFGLASPSLRRSSADWLSPAENSTNTPSDGDIRARPRVPASERLPAVANGIVAAGVEHENGGRGTRLPEPVGQLVGEEGFVLDDRLLSGLGRRDVDRQQVVASLDREAVAGVEEQRHIARLDAFLQLQHRPADGAPPEILRLHDIEAETLEFCCHGARVVARLLQRSNILIGVVADDEGDAALLGVGAGQCRERQKRAQERGSGLAEHGCSPLECFRKSAKRFSEKKHDKPMP